MASQYVDVVSKGMHFYMLNLNHSTDLADTFANSWARTPRNRKSTTLPDAVLNESPT